MAVMEPPNFVTSLLAGAAAGLVVDVTLFPLDTIKTRLQSKNGFIKTGGFKGVYKGIGPVLSGSAPTAALFFISYNTLLGTLQSHTGFWSSVNNVLAASMSEFVAGSLRVPIEVVKQRKQIAIKKIGAISMVRAIIREEGFQGMYRGFGSTMIRELPFGAIQYPLWEWLKLVSNAQNSVMIGICGAAAGAVAATFTTPMDVVKTRIMLTDAKLAKQYDTAFQFYKSIVKEVYAEKGLLGFFAGVVPRVLWITVGGFVFFGTYGKAVSLCQFL